MKREILFRGKRMCNGKWMIGNLFCCDDGDCFIVSSGFRQNHYKVDPKTVGQFTGLTDKNGKKIFEGDILLIEWKVTGRTPVHETHIVVYSKSGFFTENNGQLKGQVSNYACSNCSGLSVEVIGNIHDNPELLEGGVDNG